MQPKHAPSPAPDERSGRHTTCRATRRFVRFGYLLTLAALTVSVISNDPQWFVRAGSILVALAALLNLGALRARRQSLCTAVVGTLIWGWGDLVFNAFRALLTS